MSTHHHHHHHHKHPTITPFNSSTVALVDYCSSTESLLVRGNMPLYADASGDVYFAYSQLSTAIAALGNLPPALAPFALAGYTLIDINLTDNQGDLVDLTAELAAFGQNVSSTPFNSWPPYLANPTWVPTTIYGTRVKVAKGVSQNGGIVYWPVQACGSTGPYAIYVNTVPGYEFAQLVAYVNTLLTTKSKCVIYFHCNSGVNRTGALNVAYFLQYGSCFFNQVQNMTLQAAYTNADSVAPSQQVPSSGDVQLVQAYCNYLKTGSADPATSSPLCSYTPSSG